MSLPRVESDENTDQEREELAVLRETDKARAKRVKEAWAKVLATSEGRAVLWDIMALTGMNATPMRPGFPDLTASAIGMADAGRMVQAKCSEVAPGHALMMIKENML